MRVTSILICTGLHLALAAQAHATVTYSLSGTGTDAGGNKFPQSFTYFSPDPITSRVPLTAAQLAFAVNAEYVVFEPDLPPNSGYPGYSDAIAVQVGGDAFGYYFPVGTFAEFGTFDAANTAFSVGSVTITNGFAPPSANIPEPEILAVFGFATLAAIGLRRPRFRSSPD